ncbi:acyl carrier protein [Nocardia xishanensis]
MSIEQAVRDDISGYLLAHYEIDLSELPPDTTVRDLGVDSLGLLAIANLIEKKYGFSMDDERLASVRTLSDLLEFIRLKSEEAEQAAPAGSE